MQGAGEHHVLALGGVDADDDGAGVRGPAHHHGRAGHLLCRLTADGADEKRPESVRAVRADHDLVRSDAAVVGAVAFLPSQQLVPSGPFDALLTA